MSLSKFSLYLSVLMVIAGGCDDSGDYATDALSLRAVITDEGGGEAIISATVEHDGEALELDDGDALIAHIGEATYTLSKSPADERYTAQVEGGCAGQEVEITLKREDQDSSEASRVRMPLAFELTAPAEDATLDLSDTILITWDQVAEDSLLLSLEGDCVDPLAVTLEKDVGRYLIQPGALARVDGRQDLCPIWITLTRSRKGHVDTALKDGELRAEQVRHRAAFVR
ncbi:hypothetical protein KKF91_11390 [Myxococcota bacterium]|nr:hypothetical protein [Myxococcota bacterium]MBU1431131.1 hypothetical protein [Myxococcota bacterium]MBU1899566.1 hypothetical protein [Myxococcota bacterium]